MVWFEARQRQVWPKVQQTNDLDQVGYNEGCCTVGYHRGRIRTEETVKEMSNRR